jgi:hypothetical protein
LKLVHIASDFIAACMPEERGALLGGRAVSMVFDNTKIKRFVPGFTARMSYTAGIRRTIAWFDADAARRQVDETFNTKWDKLISEYERAVSEAKKAFAMM